MMASSSQMEHGVTVRLMERGDFATCKSLFALSLLGAGAVGGGPPQPAGSDSKGDGGGGAIDGCCHPSVRRFVDGVLGGVLASWESLQRVYSGQDGRGAVWVAVTRTRTVPPPLPAGVSVHAAVPPPALVGMVMAKRADASTVELQHLCVAESARRAGVGSGLCRAVLDWAAQGNAALCGLDTLSHMEAAARLYTALGFTHVGTRTMGRGVKEFTLLRFELRVSGAPVGAPGPAVVPVPAVTHAPSTGATAPSLRSHTSATASTGPPSTTSNEQRTAASQAATQRTRRAANAPPNGGSTAHAPSSATLWVTGAAIKLVHVASRRSSHFLVEVEKAGGAAGAGSIKLAPVDRPYDRLFALQSGKLGFGGQRGRFASFAPIAWTSQQLASVGLTGAPDEAGGRAEYVSLRSLGNPTKKNTAGEVGWHLCYRDESTGSGSDLASHVAHMSCDGAPDDVASLFRATLCPDPRAGGTAPTMLASTSSETHTVPTTGHSAVSSNQSFRTNGYAVYRSAVPSSLTDRALFRINRGLGTPGALVGGGVQDGTGKLEGGAATCPEVLGLANSPHSRVVSLLSHYIRDWIPITGAQIALRFPEEGTVDGDLPGDAWHTDGMRQGRRHPFSLLVGVALSPTRQSFVGNFGVFPGSHVILDKLLLENGRLRAVDEASAFSEVAGGGDPWGRGANLPNLGKCIQLLLEPGDVVIAHPKLAHRGCPNFSPHVRSMVYFRVKHRDFHTDSMQTALSASLYADLALSATPPTAAPLPVNLSPLQFKPRYLTEAQIHTFLTAGVLVVDGVLDADELAAANSGLVETMKDTGVETTGPDSGVDLTQLAALSSTGGAGGVLDVFYPEWKLRATLLNQKYRNAMSDILQASYGSPTPEQRGDAWAHPHGAVDGEGGVYAHIDRVGYRIPDALFAGRTASHKGRAQRSLTPHLDCCPTALHSGGGKSFPRWRPIQCMLALTSALQPNQGGFECVPGFHREFAQYYTGRADGASSSGEGGTGGGVSGADPAGRAAPPVCVGDFSPIQPRVDEDILARFEHIPVPAGAAVFWDQRIPHANSKHNLAETTRRVIYGGFLPRVPLNQVYANEQLRRMRLGLPQSDFWMERADEQRELAPTAFLDQNAAELAHSLT